MYQMFGNRDRRYWPTTLPFKNQRLECIYADRKELEGITHADSRLRWIVRNHIKAEEEIVLNGQIQQIDVLDALFKRITEHNSFSVLFFSGPSGSGKSWLALKKAFDLWIYWWNIGIRNHEITWHFSYEAVINILDQFKKGDIVLIDEFGSGGTGQDSGASAIKFDNALSRMRAEGVSFFINDPVEENAKRIVNLNYMIRTAFIIKDLFLTRSIVYTGKHQRAIGLLDEYLPLSDKHDDYEEFMEMILEYEIDKKKSLKEFKKRKAAADTGLAEKLQDYAIKLYKHCTIHSVPFKTKELVVEITDLGWSAEIYANRSEIITRTMRLVREGRKTPIPEGSDIPFEFDDNWSGLRDLLHTYILNVMSNSTNAERDSLICAQWAVPDESRASNVATKDILYENEDVRIMKARAFDQILRRKIKDPKTRILSNDDIGNIGEQFIHSLIKESFDLYIGPDHTGTCDISDMKDGNPEKAKIALNVKMSLVEEMNQGHELTPENQVVLNGGKAFAILIMPRLLQIRIFELDGSEWQTLSSEGGILTSPQNLVSDLKRLGFTKKDAEQSLTTEEQFMNDCVALVKLSGIDALSEILDQKIQDGGMKKSTKSHIMRYAKDQLKESN